MQLTELLVQLKRDDVTFDLENGNTLSSTQCRLSASARVAAIRRHKPMVITGKIIFLPRESPRCCWQHLHEYLHDDLQEQNSVRAQERAFLCRLLEGMWLVEAQSWCAVGITPLSLRLIGQINERALGNTLAAIMHDMKHCVACFEENEPCFNGQYRFFTIMLFLATGAPLIGVSDMSATRFDLKPQCSFLTW